MNRVLSRGSQTNEVPDSAKRIVCDKETQIGTSKGSYSRSTVDSGKKMNHRRLINEVIPNKETAIQWAFDNNIIASCRQCPVCNSNMQLKDAQNYSSDGCRWRCRNNGHSKDISIRKDSWFEKSNMTIEEIIELTYYWTTGTLLFTIYATKTITMK